MGLNYFASSPTLVLPPQNLSHRLMHHTSDHAATGADYTAQTSSSAKTFVARIPRPPSMNYLVQSDTSAAGRKRSRADIGEDLEDDLEAAAASSIEALHDHLDCAETAASLTKPVSSPGQPQHQAMESGQVSSSDPANLVERPRLVARKSQRVEETDGRLQHSQLEIDPVILKLGIGWKVIRDSQSPDIAGQQAFIRNNFAFQEPRILLQHEGLGILVVQSKPASAQGYWDQWWLFNDDLRSCQFLCHDENELFRRLSHKRRNERGIWQPEILVEGPVIQASEAGQVTGAITEGPVQSSGQTVIHVGIDSTRTEADVEMQM